MLGQILDVYICGDFPIIDKDRAGEDEGESKGEGKVVNVLKELRTVLKTLPNVEDVFGRAGAGFLLKSFDVDSMRALEKVMDEVLGRAEKDEAEGFAHQRGKKRKGRAGAGKAQAGASGDSGGRKLINMFELLGQDA